MTMRVQTGQGVIPTYLQRRLKQQGVSLAEDPTDSFEASAPVAAKGRSSPSLKAQHDLGVQAAQSVGASAAMLRGPLRDPEAAVRFVKKFNGELKLPKETLEKRNELMVSDAAKFLRVNPALFYSDVKGPYAAKAQLLDRTAPKITIVGDCHLANLGTIRGADGKTLWGINDYDMAGKGSPEFDLERMATSMVLMGNNEKDSLHLVKVMAKAYLDEIAGAQPEYSGLKRGEAWGPVKSLIDKKSEVDQEDMLSHFAVKEYRLTRDEEHPDVSVAERRRVEAFVAPRELVDVMGRKGSDRFYAMLGDQVLMEINQSPKGELSEKTDRTQAHVLGKYAHKEYCRLQRNEELQEATPQEHRLIEGFLARYDKTQGDTPDLQRPIKLLDMARRVDSGGSTFGLNRYYALLEGSEGLPIILEIKQQLPTATETATGDLSQADAKRIWKGMEALGGTPNPMMTTATLDGGAYFVREREREKGVLDMTSLDDDGWKAVAEQAGQALARAHGQQPGAAGAIEKWVGDDRDTLIERLQDFARSYASQTRKDTKAYAEAIEYSSR